MSTYIPDGSSWVGARVRVFWSSDHAAHGDAEVVKWEPLSSGMCDALVRFSDGYECWYATSSLWPGCEFAKAHVGQALTNAIEEVEGRVQAQRHRA